MSSSPITDPSGGQTTNFWSLAADAILLVHVLFVGFVVLGLFLIYMGGFCRWSWVRNRRFRLLHLGGIGVVVLQTWVGILCPLTTFEMALRERSGEAIYEESFIAHWLDRLLYYQTPLWVFTVCYTAFGALVLASWWIVRPASGGRSR